MDAIRTRSGQSLWQREANEQTRLVQRLLQSVVMIEQRTIDPDVRRRELLLVLNELTGADVGWWAWGRGGPDGSLIPAAVIECGVPDAQKGELIAIGMDSQLDEEFRKPIFEQMGGRNQWTTIRPEICSNRNWPSSRFCHLLGQIGLGEWLVSVRYGQPNCWSNLLFLRQTGRRPFEPRDRWIADLAMTCISWLHEQIEVAAPVHSPPELTTRQRTVLTMLLDGRSRKQIAKSLGIKEETVGDHLKSIYRHYRVKSAGELSALFLQGRRPPSAST